MGIFDFFKRKKDIEDDIDLEEALNIKEIKEEDNTNINTTNTETDSFNYNFVIDNIEEFHNRNELTPEELKSLITGEISTEAKDVWRRLLVSKGEILTNRWTPLSPFNIPYAFLPLIVIVTLLIPASSPSW